MGPDRDKQEDNEKQQDQSAEDTTHASSFTLPLITGKVTGLPKDLASAPSKLRLSQTLKVHGKQAIAQAKASGKEYGCFLHLTPQGSIRPGVLKPGTPDTWISLEEYELARSDDETIRGILHTHPEAHTVFSESNIGFFLQIQDAIHICMDAQGNYLLMLRTETTDPPRNDLFEEVIALYTHVARQAIDQYVQTHDLNHTAPSSPAIEQGLLEGMKAVCKRYNIVLYLGKTEKIASKVN